jgi:hypothetical protein
MIRRIFTAAMVLLSLVPFAVVNAQETPQGFEEGIVDVEVPGFTHKIMPAYFQHDTVAFIPLGDVLGILRSRVERSRNGSVYTGHLSEDEEFSINVVDHTLITKTDTISIDPTLYFQNDIDLYVRDTILAVALGTRVEFSMADLKTTIFVSERLPVVNYIRRRGVWASLDVASDSLSKNKLDYSFQRMLIGAAAINWTVRGLYGTDAGQSSHRESFGGALGLTMPLLFGRFTIGAFGDQTTATGQAPSSTIALTGWGWDFTIPDFPLISQVGLFGRGLNDRFGIHFTNARMGFYPTIEIDTVDGTARPGDVVELYEGQNMIAATRADSNGAFAFPVAHGRGRQEFHTIAINQYGETIEDLHVLGNRIITLEPGTVNYTVGMTADSVNIHAHGAASATVSIGLTNWLQMGAQTQMDAPSISKIRFRNDSSLIVSSIAYTMRAAVLSETALDLNYEQLSDRGGVGISTSILPEIPISVSASNIRPLHKDSAFKELILSASTGFSIFPVTVGASASHTKQQLTFTPTLGVSLGFVNVSASASTLMPFSDGTTPGETAATSTSTRRTLIPNRLNLIGVQANMGVNIPGLPGLQFGATYDNGTRKLTSFSASTTIRITSSIALGLEALVPNQDLSRTFIRAGFDWSLGPTTGRTGLTGDRQFQQINSSIGGTAYLSSEGLDLTGERNHVGSMIRLTAFHDRNGNGEQDEGEEDLGHPMGLILRNMTGDAASQPSDEDGVFRSVPEFEDIIIEIDRWVLAGDDLYPATRQFGVYMAQGLQRTIHVPYRRGYTVEGQCVIERPDLKGKTTRTSQGLSSMKIWLEPTTGTGTYDGEMFDDGTLLIMGVPAGDYKVRMDPSQLAYRRIALKDESQHIIISEDQTTMPEVILVPLTSTETSPVQER